MPKHVWPEYIRYFGPLELFRGPKAAIVNSRQSKTPAGDDPWVKKTVAAVVAAGKAGYTVVTSVGMLTWELALFAAADRSVPVMLVLPPDGGEPLEQKILDLLEDFGLERARTGVLSFHHTKLERSEKEAWPVRDQYVISLADMIYPVAIRAAGTMRDLISNIASDRQRVDETYTTKYDPRPHHEMPDPKTWKIDPKTEKLDWPFLTHFARTVHGPWPGETAREYYADLVKSRGVYPRNGLATLKRMLERGTVSGSGRGLRAGNSAVAFTEMHPVEARQLMTWRNNLVSWNFEPYGVAIERGWAEANGVRPVTYGTPEQYDTLRGADKPYFQNRGEKRDWRSEKEWRLIGDLDLNDVPPGKMRVVVRTPAEAKEVARLTKAKVVALCAK